MVRMTRAKLAELEHLQVLETNVADGSNAKASAQDRPGARSPLASISSNVTGNHIGNTGAAVDARSNITELQTACKLYQTLSEPACLDTSSVTIQASPCNNAPSDKTDHHPPSPARNSAESNPENGALEGNLSQSPPASGQDIKDKPTSARPTGLPQLRLASNALSPRSATPITAIPLSEKDHSVPQSPSERSPAIHDISAGRRSSLSQGVRSPGLTVRFASDVHQRTETLRISPNSINPRKHQPSLNARNLATGQDVNANRFERCNSPDMATPSKSYSAYDALEAAAVEAQASPASSPRTPSVSKLSHPNPPVEDNVEESVEDDLSTSEASVIHVPLEFSVDEILDETPAEASVSETVKPKEKVVPIVRATKASRARISLAHGPKDAPRPPALGRPKAPATGSRDRVISTSSQDSDISKDSEAGKPTVAIPHSKPRPMSMSFPMPAPLMKSSKPLTQSTFQLPGEAVAAKLKAAKEARLQKEAEAQRKPVFKARPAPSNLGKVPTVRPTNASLARASLMIEKKDASKAFTVSSIDSAMEKRPTSSSSKGSVTSSSVAIEHARDKVTRPSTALSRSSSVQARITRNTSTPITDVPSSSTQSARSTSATTTKGKDVFNRPAVAQNMAEREKRDREEATKKARAEAADRSRQLSREWAEKQRLRKLSGQEAKHRPATASMLEDAADYRQTPSPRPLALRV